MTYTPKQIERLAQLVSFTADPDWHKALAAEDKELAAEISSFHVEVVILQCLHELYLESKQVPSYFELRDYMKEVIFKSEANNVDLEKKIDEFLPILRVKKLINKQMKVTKLGKKMIAAKKAASYEHKATEDLTH